MPVFTTVSKLNLFPLNVLPGESLVEDGWVRARVGGAEGGDGGVADGEGGALPAHLVVAHVAVHRYQLLQEDKKKFSL